MGHPMKKPQGLPATEDRYAGKPLLILLENYVLDCIGELPAEKRREMARVVKKIYGGGKDWKATLRSVLQLDKAMDEDIQGMWARNQETARKTRLTLEPEEFARMVIDQNFAPLLG